MINKVVASIDEAVSGIADGSTILVGGFGTAGMPFHLVDALIALGARDLTIVSNNAGNGETGLAALLKARRVRKIICSFPRVSTFTSNRLFPMGTQAVFSGSLTCFSGTCEKAEPNGP